MFRVIGIHSTGVMVAILLGVVTATVLNSVLCGMAVGFGLMAVYTYTAEILGRLDG